MKTLLLTILLAQSAYAGNSLTRRYVDGQLIVKYKEGTTALVRDAAVQSIGARSVRALTKNGTTTQVKLRARQSVEDAIAELKLDPAVEYAQPNFIYHATAVPNDPDYGQLWGLSNTGQTISSPSYDTHNPGVNGADMGLETAWNTRTDCSSVVVAVIDSGVHVAHGDLAANIWANNDALGGGDNDGNGKIDDTNGWDFVDNDSDPTDYNGHGTHVAATIGAVGNNGTGSAGVCWLTKIMAVRVLDAGGSGSTADIVAGINYAVAEGAHVINMSLGGGSSDFAMNTALTNANTSNVVVVVAAGNDGTNNDGSSPSYPCNYLQPNLLCVAALDQAYSLASFSNYGATSVDVGAPGTNIVSAWNGTRAPAYTDTFNTAGSINWTRNTVSGSAWGYKLFAGTSGNYDLLANPSGWNGSTTYSINTDARVYKAFNLTGMTAPMIEFGAVVDTEGGYDYFGIGCRTAGGDPFPTGMLDEVSGSSNGYIYPFSVDASSCVGASTTVGFRLDSDNTVNGSGVAILEFQITGLTLTANASNTIDGTSMASPHVAGLAALLRAQNPSYTALEVVEAIKNGGRVAESLCGKSTTSRAADAAGSISYIKAPQGLTATAQ